MKAYVTIASAGLTAAALTMAVLSAADRWPGRAAERIVDPIVSGSIPALSPGPAAPPAQFTISNLSARTVCLAERGGALTSRSRRFAAPPDCNEVWPGLGTVENWTQNEDGSVTLSSGHGAVILTLVVGRHGFAYESADGNGDDLTWLMIP
ncbi:MAG: hypothetical protein ACOH2J_04960 [Allorhizobium sp.]